jgi:P27 family predicted phage terminase small subunit
MRAPPPPSTRRKARASPKAPAHLDIVERKLWGRILAENTIDGAAALSLLHAAMESHQRARTCRETIDKEGAVYHDRFDQPKPHPLLSVERDSRAAFLSAMRSLSLDLIGETT